MSIRDSVFGLLSTILGVSAADGRRGGRSKGQYGSAYRGNLTRPRRLGFEPLERRDLLAVFSGTVEYQTSISSVAGDTDRPARGIYVEAVGTGITGIVTTHSQYTNDSGNFLFTFSGPATGYASLTITVEAMAPEDTGGEEPAFAIYEPNFFGFAGDVYEQVIFDGDATDPALDNFTYVASNGTDFAKALEILMP